MKTAALMALILATVFLTRSVWPKEVRIPSEPRIVTVYDTVPQLDTVWKTRTLERTRWDTAYLERVTVTEPETVTVERAYMLGLTAILVGEKVGDTTMAFGFWQGPNPHTGQEERRNWRTIWYTAGPLQAISLDTFPPRAAFYNPPKPPKVCGLGCKLAHVGAGIVLGKAIDVLR